MLRIRANISGTWFSVACIAAAHLGAGVGSPETARAQTVDLSRAVRGILSDKCFKCHGPDENARQADLRLDRREDASRVLATGAGVVSPLLARVKNPDPEKRMPPPDSKLELSADEIEILERWVAAGASYEEHWAFRTIAETAVPPVQAAEWPRNPVDRFVLARLEVEALAPTESASRERLIRRLSFDLRGLPPTLEEIDAFLSDNTPDAYERLVEAFLAAPEYGERMAADWLDAARYSDTYGYQVDRDRFVWPWRDWVIDAWNANLPYDEFITSQLAGDLLPNPTDEQVLATTFNRLHPQKTEGGSVPEEFRVEYVADRNHTFATAFLGLTLECARCHDHKYDPISQREYYQLFAFFNTIDEAGLYAYFTKSVPTPTLFLADEAKKQEIRTANERVTAAEKKWIDVAASRRQAFERWLAAPKIEIAKDGVIAGRVAHSHFEDFQDGGNSKVPGKIGSAVRLSGDDSVKLEVGNFTRNQPFSFALWMQTPDHKERAVILHRSRAWTDSASRGYQLLLEDGRLSASLIHFWPGNAIRVVAREAVPTKAWVHVTVTYDGSSRAAGLKIFVDGKPAALELVRDSLYKNITGSGGDTIQLGARFRDRGFTGGLVDEVQVFERELTPLEVADLHQPGTLGAALETSARGDLKAGDAERREALRALYFSLVDAEYAKAREALQKARTKRSEAVDGVTEIMVMREMAQRRQTHVLRRGAYDAPTDPVDAGTPAAFPRLPTGGALGTEAPPDRLALARWLTDPSHPLTARVAVNRIWQAFFGYGLVRTPEDFGSQGEPPSHPGLLDWLARDFITHGWDVKHLVRRLVTSATYRQNSLASPSLYARDPENRLLARGSRYRLSAEMLRDNALALSGLLVRKKGGPPARPYELKVSFKPIQPAEGEGLYRRSLYTFWKRTAPAPVMMSLDASKREVCRVKRERTSTPLQALVLLNDPQQVEAAQVLGARIVREHGNDTDRLVKTLFRLFTSRRPSGEETRILRQLYDEQEEYFSANAERAKEFLGLTDADNELPAASVAAAAIVASTLANYDECLTKR